MDVLERLQAGDSQEAAGRRLGVSDRMVQRAVREARDRLGLKSSFQLMAWFGGWLKETAER
ncbi:hypothetical protein ACQKM2_13270 [Streptomyces sp. NPDC004126]|uniref:hypothetical protein n=1 Tax=Streptomyces sp. NPDC004126 TaxID=3390695 RepID=UPI003CFCDD7E